MRRALVALAATGILLAGCSAPSPSSSANTDRLTGSVTVFAAASLTESFQAIADAFHAEHPNVTITFNFGGSSGLATQIVTGAPADVFASASGATMRTVTDANLGLAEATSFATNTLEIAVPAGNPAKVTGLVDFTDPDKTIALCAVEVPCGAAAKAVFAAAGLVPAPDTLEQDVKSVLTKVELGEVDAGLVYRTDVIAAGDKVVGIEFPEASAATGKYQIVLLASTTNHDAAAAFIAYVRSAAGQKVLGSAGFGAP